MTRALARRPGPTPRAHGRRLPGAVLSLAALLVACAPAKLLPAPAGTPQSVAEAEHAFAALAQQGPWPAAFLAFLDDSAVLFRPRPVNGQSWMRAHLPTRDPGRLEWAPLLAGVGAGDDLGVTTGPYRLRPAGDTASYWGSFVTIWGRRPGRPWRVLLDAGTSDSVSLVPDPAAPVTWLARGDAPCGGRCGEARRAELWRSLRVTDSLLDSSYYTPDGFQAMSDGDTRVVRDFHRPQGGAADARLVATVGSRVHHYLAQPLGGAVSLAGDVGYTYGQYERVSADGSKGPARGHYVRFWRRRGARWVLGLDAESPLGGG